MHRFWVLGTLINDLFLRSLQTFYSNFNTYHKFKRMGLFPCTFPSSVYTTFQNIYLSKKHIYLHLYFNFISLIISERNSNVYKPFLHYFSCELLLQVTTYFYFVPGFLANFLKKIIRQGSLSIVMLNFSSILIILYTLLEVFLISEIY